MFDSSRPPLLVQPIEMRNFTLFPTHEGYVIHPIDNDKAIASYKLGWTFPLSVQMQALTTELPLLLVRDKGRITSSGSTFEKGYAHQFCREDGQPPEVHQRLNIFPDKPSQEWMLIRDSVTVIWLQYSSKTQYLGGLGQDMEHHYGGKLLIRNFVIQQAHAPRLDKASDIATAGEKQYRVESSTIFEHSWDLMDQDAVVYLQETLSANGISCYQDAVVTALNRAMQPRAT